MKDLAMKDLVAIAEQIAVKLVARKQTIAVAESSTGGLISASLLAVPGASAYFLGGAVVYTRDARRILADIPDDAMKEREVVFLIPAMEGFEALGSDSEGVGDGHTDAAGAHVEAEDAMGVFLHR